MLTIRALGVAVLAAALVMPFGSAARAAEPGLADVAACNEEAAARTSASALPRAGAPIVEGERELPKRGTGEKSDPTGSIVTESADPLVKGMDAQRANDPAYRAAYRTCMQTRLSRSR
jgi:hypothetical protein